MNFIRKYLGSGLTVIDDSAKKLKDQPKPTTVPGVSGEEMSFIDAIWS